MEYSTETSTLIALAIIETEKANLSPRSTTIPAWPVKSAHQNEVKDQELTLRLF